MNIKNITNQKDINKDCSGFCLAEVLTKRYNHDLLTEN